MRTVPLRVSVWENEAEQRPKQHGGQSGQKPSGILESGVYKYHQTVFKLHSCVLEAVIMEIVGMCHAGRPEPEGGMLRFHFCFRCKTSRENGDFVQ